MSRLQISLNKGADHGAVKIGQQICNAHHLPPLKLPFLITTLSIQPTRRGWVPTIERPYYTFKTNQRKFKYFKAISIMITSYPNTHVLRKKSSFGV